MRVLIIINNNINIILLFKLTSGFLKHSLSHMTCEGDDSILWSFFLLWFILNVIFNQVPFFAIISVWKWAVEGNVLASKWHEVIANCDVSEGELYCLSLYILHCHQETPFSSSRPERTRLENNTESATSCLCMSMNASLQTSLSSFSLHSVNVEFYFSSWTFYQIFQGRRHFGVKSKNMELFIQALSTVMWTRPVHKCHKHFRDAST